MLRVRAELCDGCGACLGACRPGAIRLQGAKAVIDSDLCVQCGDCIDACPLGAISWEEGGASDATLPVPRPVPEVIHIAQPARLESKRRWLAVTGAALSFLGREIVPRAANWLLDTWDRRQALDREGKAGITRVSPTSGSATKSKRGPTPTRGRGFRHRHGRGPRT